MERQPSAPLHGARVILRGSGTARIRNAAWRLAVATVLAAGGLVNSAPVVSATTAGGLDPTFGPGGRVVTNLGSNRYAVGVALQADGKIVALGSQDITVARYNADGTLDATFGSGGSVITDFGAMDFGRAVAIQSDGKIVALGTTGCCSGPFAVVLARYNNNGTLDSSFDGDGKVTLPLSSTDNFAASLAMQADGKILLGGSLDGQLLVVRLDSDGSMDNTFGTGGEAVPFNDTGLANSIAVLPDGRIVAGGTRTNCCGNHDDFLLARLNDDGTPDLTFGPSSDGRVVADLNNGSEDDAFGIAIQSDDSTVVAGISHNVFAPYDIAVARFASDGSLDPTFGTNGLVITDLGANYEVARAVALDGDGKVIVAGQSTGNTASDFFVIRYNTDGTPDAGFGAAGVVLTDFGSTDDKAMAVAVQPDGNIVAGGYTLSGSYQFALARYLGVVPPATVPAAPADVTAAAGDGQASVSWLTPADGGSPITGYTIEGTSTAGNTTTPAGPGATSVSITGLTNGADYTFTVTAANDVGTGPTSAQSNVVRPQAGAPPPQTTTEEIPVSGGEATTDPGGGPTSGDPVTTTLTVPPTVSGGSVTISETAVTESPPPGGYQFLGQQIDITSSAATDADNPLRLVFKIDSSMLLQATGMLAPPAGSIDVTRAESGSPAIIAGCTSFPPSTISPDPCVSDRQYVGDDLQITILTGSASHWNTAVKPTGVVVSDGGYAPKVATVAQGSIVLWTFAGLNPHSVTDSLKLGASKVALFDSGQLTSGRFGASFQAAGAYTYISTVKADRKFAGTVAVPLAISPLTGGTSTTFTVTWSSATISGYVFDIQYRFKRAGSKNFGTAKIWLTGQSTTSGGFVPPSGAGTYALSARLRNATTGVASLWSPDFTITVQ